MSAIPARPPMPGAVSPIALNGSLPALTDIYGWYQRNAQLLGNVMRDVERHPEVQELQKRAAPVRKGWHDVLGEGFLADQRAMLYIALSFFTWRTLTQQAGVKQAAAVSLMVEAVLNAAS